jgi:hypothetical protein
MAYGRLMNLALFVRAFQQKERDFGFKILP